MQFVVSAGGTAGHINPALAVADELRGRGHDILFVGTPDHLEATLARDAGFEFAGFRVSGFDKAHPTTLVTSGVKILRAARTVQRLFGERRVDAAVTFGAYVCVPVGLAATRTGVPLVVHEQNSIPGMANVFLAQRADAVALAYDSCAQHLDPKSPPVVCGNPVRASFGGTDRATARRKLSIPMTATVLSVMGGSLGASHINRAVCKMKKRLLSTEDLVVIHSAGQGDFEATEAELALRDKQRERWRLFSYIDDIADVLAASDLVISRAGASSLAEIATLGVPSVLVPYPHARADHQTLNAHALADIGAACIVADSDLDTDGFPALVLDLLSDPARLVRMSRAARTLSGHDARTALADLVCSVARPPAADGAAEPVDDGTAHPSGDGVAQ